MENLFQFMGRFHPLLVHLPLGMLILAIVFDVLAKKERFKGLEVAVPLSYLLGAISAIFTCITGYLLSLSGEYEAEAIDYHQWMGIALAVLASLLYAQKHYQPKLPQGLLKAAPWMCFGLLALTGHLGAALRMEKII